MKTIIIDGIIGWETYPRGIRNQLDSAKGEDIEIQISSPGGFVWDGLEIFNIIRDYKKKHKSAKTKSRLMGLAASMASYITLSTDEVEIEENAVFMIHNARAFEAGDQNTLRKMADILEGLSNLLAKEYSKKSGISEKEIKSMMNNETFFFSDEIVNNGFADRVLKSENKIEKQVALATAKLSIENCFETMKKSEKIKNDFEKAAAFLNIDNFDNQNIVDDDTVNNSTIENTQSKHQTEITASTAKKNDDQNNQINIGGVKHMTLKEFKASHPDLYSQIYKNGITAGIEKENKRVTSFVQAMAVLPEAKEIYIKAIEEKKGINDPSIQASVISLMKAKKTVANSTDENLDDVDTEKKKVDKATDGEKNDDDFESIDEAQNVLRDFYNIDTKEVN